MMHRTICLLWVLMAWVGCSEPYDFESIGFEPSIVINARLTNELQKQEIILATSYSIENDSAKYISGASVTVANKNGDTHKYLQGEDGIYRSEIFAGQTGSTYRVMIRLENGTEINSDWETLPEPVSVKRIYGKYNQLIPQGANQIESGIQFFLDTDGLSGQSASFRYEWEETYQIKSPFPSQYEIRIDSIWDFRNDSLIIDSTIVLRPNNISICYNSNRSAQFLIGSTSGSVNNKLEEFPIRFVPENGSQLRTKYSIGVKQFRLTERAFQFYKLLKENNESGGFLFDKQLGEVKGNFRALDGTNVLGFFEVSSVDSLRVFFKPGDFSGTGFRAPNYGRICSPETIPINMREDSAAFLVLTSLNFQITSIYSIPFINDEGNSELQIRANIYPRLCTSCDWYADVSEPSFWE